MKFSKYKPVGWRNDSYRHSLAAKGIKTSFVKVIESSDWTSLRIRRGYKDILTVDAIKLKKAFEKDNDEDLVWRPERLPALESESEFERYPELEISNGKIDFNDGRHRVAVAASRGETIDIAVRDKNKFLAVFEKRRSFVEKEEDLVKSNKELYDKYGLFVDNPGGQWLEDTKDRAANSESSGSVTAGSDSIPMSVDDLLELKGDNFEETRMDSKRSKDTIKNIKESIERDGFNQKNGPMIWVRYDGSVSVAEGNHRIQAAKELGIEELPVQFRWFSGAENIDGKWGLRSIKKRLESDDS